MTEASADRKMLTGLMFRLLLPQFFFAVVSAVNGIVSTFFASNYLGVDAMSAVGLYSPINMLLAALSIMLVAGTSMVCGKYLGQNDHEKVQHIFSLSFFLNLGIALVFTVLFLLLALFDLTGIFTSDTVVRPLFNRYLLGQCIGLYPFLAGSQMATFLAMENQGRRTMLASLASVVTNLLMNILFIRVLHMNTFGLALAAALGLWVFFGVQAHYFLGDGTQFRFQMQGLPWQETIRIMQSGFSDAASSGYQAVRGIIVNRLLEVFIGTIGISALATSDNLLRIFWALPTAMINVSRMMLSLSIGEEDRQTLTDTMRVMFRRFVPLMGCISLIIICLAKPLTSIFYHDPTAPVYQMTVWGFRILPLCMPLSIICMHFVTYATMANKKGLDYLLTFLDGVLCVAGFTAILIRFIGMNSVYIANVLNGVVCLLVIIAYAWIRNQRFPKTMSELMTIAPGFGVDQSERMDVTVRSTEEVVGVSQQVQAFCTEKGIDEKRAYLAALALEEMVGNIVEHGFTKDKKKHTIDLRVVHKGEDLLLRIKDDCVPFDPKARKDITDPDDITKNIGIRMIYKMTDEIQYQNIFGMNVLTMKI